MALFLYRIWRKKRRTLFVLLLVASGSFAFNSGWRWTFGHDDDGFEKLLDQMVATELKNAERIRDCYEPGDEDANWRGHKPCEPLTDLPRGCPLPPDDLRRNLDVRPVTFCDSDGFEPPDKKDVGCTVPMNKTKRCEFADVRSWYVLRTSSGAAASVVKFGCPHQRFAGFSGESEAYYPNFLSGKERGEFNLSVDYRRSSDVPVTYYDPPAYDLRAVPLSYEQKRKKEAIATAFVSNCGSRNNREMWLSEMIKLIKVQSYGSCHHTAEVDKDVREKYASDSWRLKIQASRRFLFQLVFENSDVTDYVTEKLYQALEAGTVPIYMGAKGEIWRHIPNRTSIIYVGDFKGPEDLAAHVQKVAENKTLYESYLEWKKWPFSKEWKELERIAFVGWRCRAAHLVAGIPFRWRGAFDDQPKGVFEYGAREEWKRKGSSTEGSDWKDPWLDGEAGWKILRRRAWMARKKEELRAKLLEQKEAASKRPRAPRATGDDRGNNEEAAIWENGYAPWALAGTILAVAILASIIHRLRTRREHVFSGRLLGDRPRFDPRSGDGGPHPRLPAP